MRQITAVRDLATFRRFLALLATRAGQMLNKTDLAAPFGVSVLTVTDWLGVLEATGRVLLVPPFYENFGKRLVKSPKVHFMDSGLAAHLLGIASEAELRRSPFLGALFEGFVASEIAKLQTSLGRRPEVYYFRDQQGLEVDLVVPAGGARLVLLEAKASATVAPQMAEPSQPETPSAGLRFSRHAFGWRPASCPRPAAVSHSRSGLTPATGARAASPGIRATNISSGHGSRSRRNPPCAE